MAKPKAPEWLRLAFRDGVDEREEARLEEASAAYPGAWAACWLAQFDTRMRSCTGQHLGVVPNLERCHLIPRQRVEGTMWEQLRWSAIYEVHSARVTEGVFRELSIPERDALILLAAWDPRNGVMGCQGHHRRFDGHATPGLWVPEPASPVHLREFVDDNGLWSPYEERFPAVPVAS